MHQHRVRAAHEQRCPAAAAEELLLLLVADAREQRRIGDLVAVQVQDGQHHAIGQRIQELVGVPGRGQWPGFRLTIPDDAGCDQFRIVKHRAKRVAERVAELAALVDGSRALGRSVAGYATRERELREQSLQPGLILAYLRIDFAVGAFQVGITHHRRPTVPWAAQVDHVQIVLADDPVQMHVDEVLARRGTPVAEQHGLDVLKLQGLAQQRIVAQVDLPDGQVVRRAPVGVHGAQQLGGGGSLAR